MLKNIENHNDGTYTIHIEFEAAELKAGEALSGTSKIKGTEAQANDYAELTPRNSPSLSCRMNQ